MQVLCGLQGIFLLFNCQTPVLFQRLTDENRESDGRKGNQHQYDQTAQKEHFFFFSHSDDLFFLY